jgi:hypothetical protein
MQEERDPGLLAQARKMLRAERGEENVGAREEL